MMLNDKVIKTTFTISLAGHCLLLGISGFNLASPHIERRKEITIRIQTEKAPLVPKPSKELIEEVIEPPREAMSCYQDIVKQKIEEEVMEKSEFSEPEPKRIVMEEPSKESTEEKIEVIESIKKMVHPNQDMVEQMIEGIIEESEPHTPESDVNSQSEELTDKTDEQQFLKPAFEGKQPENQTRVSADEIMSQYQGIVKQGIEKTKRYPNWAKRQEIEGVVGLSFTILSNGISQDIKITRSSGSKILDEAAIETIKRANPFPPIPKEIDVSSVRMEMSIVFTLDYH